MSHKCNQYIVKNDEFVRNFEEMYLVYEDPWEQQQNAVDCITTSLTFSVLERLIELKKIKQILDIGCANGYYAKNLTKIFFDANYIGTDISKTVIDRARAKERDLSFIVNDIRVRNDEFVNQFELIFSAKVLYYVAPEIDDTLKNIDCYLKNGGYFSFIYNHRSDSFSNKWLNYELLREKVLSLGYKEIHFMEINRFSSEKFSSGLFQKL
jgi:SAM-dependent methyltransferase